MRTDYEQAQAVVNAMYDACKMALETPGNLMPPRDYFDKLLGDTAQSYAIRGYEEIADERDRYRRALEDIKSVCDEQIAGGTGWDYVAISNFVRKTLHNAAPFAAGSSANAAPSAPDEPPAPQ